MLFIFISLSGLQVSWEIVKVLLSNSPQMINSLIQPPEVPQMQPFWQTDVAAKTRTNPISQSTSLVQPLRDHAINMPDSLTVAYCTKLPPKMSLEEFTKQYSLLNSIWQGLDEIEVTGPHALRFISDSVLSDSAMLFVGQIADICDAQEWWQNNNDENTAPQLFLL